jgi:hypothetical protein
MMVTPDELRVHQAYHHDRDDDWLHWLSVHSSVPGISIWDGRIVCYDPTRLGTFPAAWQGIS